MTNGSIVKRITLQKEIRQFQRQLIKMKQNGTNNHPSVTHALFTSINRRRKELSALKHV